MNSPLTAALTALCLLIGTDSARAAEATLPAACATVTFEATGFVACTVDPATSDIRLFLEAPDGKPYGSLEAFTTDGPPVAFAMNAGMYLEDSRPEGLYIEAGKTITGLNRRDAKNLNFYLKPNGVFTVSADGHAAVVETDAYQASPDIAYATQSGPMLVIDGELHPAFDETKASLKVRNGVGVRADGTVVFAISREPVSFSRFARLFRDQYACRNALFLDGVVSTLASDDGVVVGGGHQAGPIVAVMAR
jgi:uncharacterized protein YigE (DUF2233 family)